MILLEIVLSSVLCRFYEGRTSYKMRGDKFSRILITFFLMFSVPMHRTETWDFWSLTRIIWYICAPWKFTQRSIDSKYLTGFKAARLYEYFWIFSRDAFYVNNIRHACVRAMHLKIYASASSNRGEYLCFYSPKRMDCAVRISRRIVSRIWDTTQHCMLLIDPVEVSAHEICTLVYGIPTFAGILTVA